MTGSQEGVPEDGEGCRRPSQGQGCPSQAGTIDAPSQGQGRPSQAGPLWARCAHVLLCPSVARRALGRLTAVRGTGHHREEPEPSGALLGAAPPGHTRTRSPSTAPLCPGTLWTPGQSAEHNTSSQYGHQPAGDGQTLTHAPAAVDVTRRSGAHWGALRQHSEADVVTGRRGREQAYCVSCPRRGAVSPCPPCPRPLPGPRSPATLTQASRWAAHQGEAGPAGVSSTASPWARYLSGKEQVGNRGGSGQCRAGCGGCGGWRARVG